MSCKMYCWDIHYIIVSILKQFTVIFFQLVRRMGRLMVPRVKYNNPLGTQKTISLDYEEFAREGR